jgi:hypothetical protein
VLVTPSGTSTASTIKSLNATASAAGLDIEVFKVSTSQDIDAAFMTFAQQRPDAVFVSPNPFFRSRRVQLTHLATPPRMPSDSARKVANTAARAGAVRAA